MKYLRLKKKEMYSVFPLALLFFCFCEFLYTQNSGEKSSIVLIVLCMTGIFYNTRKKKKMTVNTVICYTISIYALIYRNNSEGIRYFLMLVALINWSEFRFNKIEEFVELLVASGGILCVVQLLNGRNRVYGFFANSPTQMSCVLWVCLVYLMICLVNQGFDKIKFVYATICIPLIYATGSRSTLAAGSIIYAIYLIMQFIKCFPVRKKKYLFLIVLIPVVALILLNTNQLWSFMEGKLHRSNQNASTMTRTLLYNSIFRKIVSSGWAILFGYGGGYIETFLGSLFDSNGYFPAHQDYLLIMCEYGLVGLISVFYFFLKKHKARLYFILVFTICSFHNIILTPTTMLLMAITMVDIENKGYKIILKNII